MYRTTAVLSVALAIAAIAPVVAQSPPPYAEDAELTFERVGPSAWRAVEPNLDCEQEPFGPAEQTVVAPDGRVWLFSSLEGIRQLGDCPLPVQSGGPFRGLRDQALAPDGTLWVMDRDRLLSWNDGDWIVHLEGEFNVPDCTDGAKPITYEEFEERGGECSGGMGPNYLLLDIAPAGAVWLSGLGSVGRYADGEWHEYIEDWMGEPNTLGHGRLGFGPDGAVWVWGLDSRYVFYP